MRLDRVGFGIYPSVVQVHVRHAAMLEQRLELASRIAERKQVRTYQ